MLARLRMLAACAALALGGCAQILPPDRGPSTDPPRSTGSAGWPVSAGAMHVEPVYRISRVPSGSAAGQVAAARIDLAQGRIRSAIDRFRQALVLDPGRLDAYNGLGIAHGRLGHFEEAERAFEAALATGARAPHLLNNLGYAQFRAGRLAEAWRWLREAWLLDPRNAATRENLRQLAVALRAQSGQAPEPLSADESSAGASPASAVSRAVPRPGRNPVPVTIGPLAPKPGLIEVAPGIYELRSAAPQATGSAATTGLGR
ncbi:MAG: tetratricopeptide repeat protein [Burkholderiaceae bacterium]